MSAVWASAAPLHPENAARAGLVALFLALGVMARQGFSGWDVAAAAATLLLVWVAAIDLESRLIPNRLVLPAAAVLVAIAAALDPLRGAEHALAALAAGGFLLLAAAARPGALGMGDAKLALLLGALLGFAVLEALIICFGLVALTCLALVVGRGRSALNQQLPLAPFLAAGAFAALLLPG